MPSDFIFNFFQITSKSLTYIYTNKGALVKPQHIFLITLLATSFLVNYSIADDTLPLNPEIPAPLPIDLLNSTNIPLEAERDVQVNEIDHYTVSVNMYPEESRFDVFTTILVQKPDGFNLSYFAVNHYLQGFSDAFTPIEERNSQSSYPLGFQDVNISYAQVKVNGLVQNYTIHNPFLNISLPESLESTFTISIDYEADVPESRRRFGKMSRLSENPMFSMQHIVPSVAVFENNEFVLPPFGYAGESFYQQVAVYDVTLNHPVGFVIGATGKLESTSNLGNGRIESVYYAEKVRDWSLVGSFDYILETTTVNLPYSNRTVRIHSLYLESFEEYFKDQDRFAAQSIYYFSKLYNEYAYDDFVSAQVDAWFGGMEYPQLVLITSFTNAISVESVVAHEVAHEWNWVMLGTNQFNEGFFDEGLTSYMQERYNREYGLSSFSGRIRDMNSYFTNVKAYDLTSPINQTIFSGDPNLSYLYYTKSSLVFDDLTNTLGEELFDYLIKNLHRKYRFDIAQAIDLVDYFASALNQTWIYDYFDLFWNTGEFPTYKTIVQMLSFNQTHTVLSVEIVGDKPAVVQRLRLQVEDNADNGLLDKSFLIKGSLSFEITLNSTQIQSVKLGKDQLIMAQISPGSWNLFRFYFSSTLYNGPKSSSTSEQTETNTTTEVTTTKQETSSSSTSDESTPFLGYLSLVVVLISITFYSKSRKR